MNGADGGGHLGEALRCAVTQAGRTSVVVLTGSLQLDSADELRTQLPALVTDASPNLVVDLSALQFMNSIGIAALVAANRRAREVGGRVGLVQPGPAVDQLLKITRVSELIPIFANLDAARAAVES